MADPTAQLLVKIGADTKGLKKGMDAAEKRVGGFAGTIKKHQRAIGMAMAGMGAAILAVGALSVKAFAKMGDEVQKMALRTGFSTEALSELRHAAELSGTSLAGLEKASRTLSGAILDAGFGLETYVRAFDQLGLSYEQLKPLSPEKQFLAVLEALAGLSDESERAALAADLFGRAGTALLPMLVDGADGLAAMRQEAHELGIVFDQEAANKAAEFNDALTKLKGSVTGVMMEVGSLLVDSLKPLIDRVTEVIKKITAWTDKHPDLTKVIVNTSMAIGGLLVVMGTLILLKIPALIGLLITWGKTLVAVAIPAVWAFVTALWAQVTATLAAMAATGVLIPAAIIAVAAIAALTIGITALVKNQREQYDSTNAVIDAITRASESTREATETMALYNGEVMTSTEAWKLYEEELAAAADKTRGLNEEIKALTGTMKDAVVSAFLFYSTLGRPLTSFEQEQRTALGRTIGIPGLAHGGIVTSPTLALVGEKGPEAIVPLDKMGGITINFHETVFTDNEASLNRFVDKITRAQNRNQRLNFGRAYSG